jgi:propionate CoA-transferase
MRVTVNLASSPADLIRKGPMKIVSAPAAASLVQNGDAVLMSGSGGGHGVPEAVLAAIELRFLETGAPA